MEICQLPRSQSLFTVWQLQKILNLILQHFLETSRGCQVKTAKDIPLNRVMKQISTVNDLFHSLKKVK